MHLLLWKVVPKFRSSAYFLVSGEKFPAKILHSRNFVLKKICFSGNE